MWLILLVLLSFLWYSGYPYLIDIISIINFLIVILILLAVLVEIIIDILLFISRQILHISVIDDNILVVMISEVNIIGNISHFWVICPPL